MAIVLLNVEIELEFVKILLVCVDVASKKGLVEVKEFIISDEVTEFVFAKIGVVLGVAVLDSNDGDVTSKVVDGKVKMPKVFAIELVSKPLVVLGMAGIEPVVLVISLVKAVLETKKLLSLVELIVLVTVKVEKLVNGNVD